MVCAALRRSLTLLLLVIFTASMMLADPGGTAMLVATGNVRVNGAAVPRSTAVFRGDNIRTTNGGAVSLTLSGSTVLIPSDSSVVIEPNAIAVNGGTVVIDTASGLKAHTSTYTVAPARGRARFQVARLNGAITIHAVRGSLMVSSAAGDSTLPEGKSETLNDVSGKDDSQGPPPAAAAGGGGVSKRTLLIVGGVAGGAAAAIALLTTGSPSPASNTNPGP